MTSSASLVCPLTPVQIVPPRKNVEDTGGTYRTNPPAVRFRIPGMEPMHSLERSVAVIGSGVAGLVAAYALSARDRVTLFEADTRIGGHAHTHYIDRGDGSIVGVDTAFLVHNDRTYPTLCRLFAELGIATKETDMSMSVRDDGSGLEYAGARGIGGLFPSWSSLGRPRYLLMLAEVKRFHAAVWSCPPGETMRYPARYLFMFLEHHGMLSVLGSPTWRTVVGGSANYVEAILNRIDEVRAGDPVTSVQRFADGVQITAGATRIFDAAVIATHPDHALLMLAEPTAAERAVLGSIPYCTNHAQLHTDESVLPRHRRARASWNYLVAPNNDGVLVTYDVTRLMRLDGPRRFLVTLGGRDHVDPATVLTEMTYSHPMYTPESVAARQLLPTLDDDRVAFAGAYHGWGFHEDGAASGLRAARRLGAQWPTAARRAEAVAC